MRCDPTYAVEPALGVGHAPGPLNIGLGGQFASWAGMLEPILILADTRAG